MKKRTYNSCKVPLEFIGIGAPCCGTTWLAKCLNEHPQICISKTKERGVFDKNTTIYSKEVFNRNFSHCKKNALRGTFPVDYLYKAEYATFLAENAPDIKIIVILRNPIERLQSNILQKQSTGKIPNSLSIDKFKNKKLLSFINASHYQKHLPAWLSLFRKEQIFIGIYEEIAKNQHSFLKKIYRFLEVDDSFTAPSTEKIINSTILKRRRIRLATFLITQLKSIGKYIKKNKISRWIIQLWRYTNLHKTVDYFENINTVTLPELDRVIAKPLISTETYNKLLEIYEEDITYSEKVTEKDLGLWRTGMHNI